MLKKPFYLSLTIPYVNSTPHIGYALEAVQGDAIARYQRLLGKNVFFVYGSDENSLKNVQAAEKANEEVGSFVARHAKAFSDLQEVLNLSNTDFIRTTEERHVQGAQKLWAACNPEDLYKKSYSGLYCVGCETFYSEDELVEGLCPDHKKAPELVEEENYFFKLSNYQEHIQELLEKDIVKVHPPAKKNEMLAFMKEGLKDFSISRSTERAHGWGVPVPGDDSQMMYVWFDALSNYITALGYAEEKPDFEKFWVQKGQENREVVHVLGKGVARFHLVYWLGMLLSAKLPLPTDEFVHGYITVNGEKMSKSIGNVLHPVDVVKEYKQDPTRYYFLRAVSSFQDGDFSAGRFKELYTAELVNGVGNLTSRILTMIEKYSEAKVPAAAADVFDTKTFWAEYHKQFSLYAFHDLTVHIQSLVRAADGIISEQEPWKKVKTGEDISELLYQLVEVLRHIALALLPIMPKSAEEILQRLGIQVSEDDLLEELCVWGGIKEGFAVEKGDPLFARLEA